MSPDTALQAYVDAVRRRLHARLCLRALAVALLVLLLGSLLAALLPAAVRPALRLAVPVAALLGAAVFAWRPWQRLRQHPAAELEQWLPRQQGRLLTWYESQSRAAGVPAGPLQALLAEDAWRIAQEEPPARHPGPTAFLPAAGVGLLALAVLSTLLWWPGLRMPALRQLWGLDALPVLLPPAQRRIDVQPGDAVLRRNQDLRIDARLVGFEAGEAQLHVQFPGDPGWDAQPLQAGADGRWSTTLFALREPLRYYVSAGGLRSAEHQLRVVDVPAIEQLQLTYHFPSWTGLPLRRQSGSGHIEAVEGTRVTVALRTDQPLQSPRLQQAEGASALRGAGQSWQGELRVVADGEYRLTTQLLGETVALADAFRITVLPDAPPTVEVRRPGRDHQATAIEEVPVQVRARDDYRIDALQLHYAVNGGAWRQLPLPAGRAEVSSEILLALETLATAPAPLLVPGDIVSYYVEARDRRHSVRTDLYLVQVQPFDRRYAQGQGGGGGGGGGDGEDDSQIAERQREILFATFNLARERDSRGDEAARVADNAAMLADLQRTLADQARTLVERSAARELAASDPRIQRFVEAMEAAAQAMQPAAEKLAAGDLQAALAAEQTALQHLLRAEAGFRDIQVAAQSANRSGGGRGGQAGRDVAEMTELELDLEKNQYETERPASPAAARQAEDEALRRLRDLARRQEQLADRAQRPRQQAAPPSRWQQEQLQREAEALQRELERRGREAGAEGDATRQAAAGASTESAERLRQAVQAMREGRPGAAEALRRAAERLQQGRREAVEARFDDLRRRAEAVAEQQRRSQDTLRARAQDRGGMGFDEAQRLAERKRSVQQSVAELEAQLQAARQALREPAPAAAERLAEAARQLAEAGVGERLARSALEIERGRLAPAATRDPLISEAIQGLGAGIDEAGRLAVAEVRGAPGPEGAEDPAGRSAGDAGFEDAAAVAEGLLAQLGGLRGDLQSRGAPGRRDALRDRAGQLQALQQRLPQGSLPDADVRALRELGDRLRRGAVDPMSAEYPRLQALVSQVELSALRAARAAAPRPGATEAPRPAAAARDDAAAAEYYRRLGSSP